LRIEADIRKNGKMEKATEFVKNKEKTGGSQSSIRKSTSRDKATAKQKKGKSQRVEKRRQSDVEYKGFGVQRKISKETSEPVCGSIFHQQGSIY